MDAAVDVSFGTATGNGGTSTAGVLNVTMDGGGAGGDSAGGDGGEGDKGDEGDAAPKAEKVQE